MNGLKNWWGGLRLQVKLQVLVLGMIVTVLGAVLGWVSEQLEHQTMDGVEARAVEAADGLINGMNTLMLVKIGNEDVISDPAARATFLRLMGVSDRLKEMRVVRGKAIDDEYKPGLPQEQAVDDLDRQVLADGKPVTRVVYDSKGAGLRLVTPFFAKKLYRSNPCLDCHAVEDGAVVGAASVTIDIQEELAALHGIRVWIWSGFVALVVLCTALLHFIARSVVRRLGGEPEAAAEMARHVAHGDLTVSLDVPAGDTTSLMARLQEMRVNLERVVADVRHNAEAVASTSAEISGGSSELAQRTEAQVSALREAAASMEELSASVRRNAQHAQQANELAKASSAVALAGGREVGGVVETMKSIQASSQRIASIISVIDDIAFRTNLLALNAAVEAARAGEQGRGFAVVASEVRMLASRTSDAAREVKGLIDESVQCVEQGTVRVDKAGETMQGIVRSIEQVTSLMGQISSASAEQSDRVARIGEAVVHMDDANRQNAVLVEQSAESSERLNAQARQLVDSVSVFRLRETA